MVVAMDASDWLIEKFGCERSYVYVYNVPLRLTSSTTTNKQQQQPTTKSTTLFFIFKLETKQYSSTPSTMSPPASSETLDQQNFSSLNDYIKHTYGSTNSEISLRELQAVSSRDDSAECNIGTLCRPPSEEGGDSEGESLISGKEVSGSNWTLRRFALDCSLYLNLLITFVKFIAYARTLSLSVLAALLDSVLDVVSQFVLNYTERHSSIQRSSAFYPAGASRLEPSELSCWSSFVRRIVQPIYCMLTHVSLSRTIGNQLGS